METTGLIITGTPADIADGLKRYAAEHATHNQEPSFEDDKMTVQQAVDFLECHYETLNKWIRTGKIRCHGTRKKRFVLRSELIEDCKSLK